MQKTFSKGPFAVLNPVSSSEDLPDPTDQDALLRHVQKDIASGREFQQTIGLFLIGSVIGLTFLLVFSIFMR